MDFPTNPMVAKWLHFFEPLVNEGVPGIYQIWREARNHIHAGNLERAKQYENLIYLLHNSVVSAECELSSDVRFAYGGIGIVVHKHAEIGRDVMIGQGSTIGGNPGTFRISPNGQRLYVPKISDHVYMAAGSRVLGGIEIGTFSVIATNAVVTRDVPPFSIVAGSPAKVIKAITKDNCLKYKSFFGFAKKMSNDEYVSYFNDSSPKDVALSSGDTELPPVTTRSSSDEHETPPSLNRNSLTGPLASAPIHDNRPSPVFQARLKAITTLDHAQRGRSIINTGVWAPPNFRPEELNGTIFTMAESDQGRTWLWWLHQFEFIIPLIAVDRFESGSHGLQQITTLLQAWSERFSDNLDFEHPAWHDHATALRARNLLLLRSHLLEQQHSTQINVALSETLIRLLELHGAVLARDDFYNAGNNHGLDQSIVLFELANEIPTLANATVWCAIATRRIASEVSLAYAPDGGHIENSPGYQNYGVQQLVNIYKSLKGYSYNAEDFLPKGILERAVRALTHLIRPDGKLPRIGDTYDFNVTDVLREIKPEGYEEFLFSIRKGQQGKLPQTCDLVLHDSGWAILRGAWLPDSGFQNALHLTLKSGFLSTFHRHDDDLQIELYAFGEDWIVDGGLYKHLNNDPYRVFLRSADAHSIPMPIGFRASRDLKRAQNITKIVDASSTAQTAKVHAESGMFPGFITRRTILLDRKSLSLQIHDTCETTSNHSYIKTMERRSKGYSTYLSRFVVPENKRVVIDRKKNHVIVTGKNKTLCIKATGNVSGIKLFSGATEPKIRGWASYQRGQLEKATAIEFYCDEQAFNATFDLYWN